MPKHKTKHTLSKKDYLVMNTYIQKTVIAGLVAPGLFAVIFAYFIEPVSGRPQLPGAPYLLAALLLVVAAGVAAQATRRRPPADRRR